MCDTCEVIKETMIEAAKLTAKIMEQVEKTCEAMHGDLHDRENQKAIMSGLQEIVGDAGVTISRLAIVMSIATPQQATPSDMLKLVYEGMVEAEAMKALEELFHSANIQIVDRDRFLEMLGLDISEEGEE